MIDIKAIKAAAEAAPQDAWRYESYGQTVWADDTYMVADIRGWGYLQQRPNGADIQDATGIHIATANPATVLEMCEEIEQLRKDAARYQWLKRERVTSNYEGELGIEFECGFDHWNDIDAAIDAAMRGGK